MASSPIGTLIILGVLLFIVYRALLALGASQAKRGRELPRETARRSAPPPSPGLAPVLVRRDESGDPFLGDERAKEAETALVEKGGMTLLGDYTIQSRPGLFMRVYSHPEQLTIAIAYLEKPDRFWVNLITEYADGRVITSSSGEREEPSSSRPRGMPVFHHPGAPADQLLRRHKLETRGVDRKPALTADEFPGYYAMTSQRLAAYVYEREQSEAPPPRPPIISEPLPSRLEERIETDFAPTPGQLRQWLDLICEKMSIPRERRGEFQKSLIWIAEQARPASIAGTLEEYAGVRMAQTNEGKLIVRPDPGATETTIDPGNLTGPALFEKINDMLPEEKRFTRIPVDVEGVAFYSRQAFPT